MKPLAFLLPLPLAFVAVLAGLAQNARAISFEPCYQKNSSAIYNIDGYNGVGVSKDLLIIPADPLPQSLNGAEIVKASTHLKLLLVKTKTPHEYIKLLPIERAENKEVAVIVKNSYQVGKLLSKQMAFDLATFSTDTPRASVLGIKCYSAVGIGMGGNKFIQTKYIDHFIKTDPLVYSDLGLRFFERTTKVSISNPYMYPQIKSGDVILKLNGAGISNIAQFEDAVIFSKPGETFNIVVQRGSKELSFSLKSMILISESYDTETFLEKFGVFFDENLSVKRVDPGSVAFGKKLRAGDRLVQIDKASMASARDAAVFLSKKPPAMSRFLFQRGGFQFFITLEDELYKTKAN